MKQSKKEETSHQANGLPKFQNKKEDKIKKKVMKWFEKNYPHSVALEIKIKGNNLLPHQEVALKRVWAGAFSYKIPDTGRRNPFDAIVLKDAHPLVIVYNGSKYEAYNLYGDKLFEFKP